MSKIIRSPFFYVGDKYKLMPQIQKYLPTDISVLYEPFLGGGSSFLNIKAKKYVLNDIDKNIIALHRFLKEHSSKTENFFSEMFKYIRDFRLSCSFLGENVDPELKVKYKKTYYAVYNKSGYMHLRDYYNKNPDNLYLLYILLIYGFNHFLRFNLKGKFNLPVGNVDFNKNVKKALDNYFQFMSLSNVIFTEMDYKDFIKQQKFEDDSFIYFDPPYLVSMSEYNKLWDVKDEIELYKYIDLLNDMGVNFGISNMISHKGRRNVIFEEWSSKYITIEIESNYISYHDNTKKNNSREVFVTNYDNSKSKK